VWYYAGGTPYDPFPTHELLDVPAVEARAGVVQGYIALQRALGAGWDAEEQAVQAAMSAESTQSENAR
jgi:hypothetical protein